MVGIIRGGLVQPNPALPVEARTQALATISWVGLNRYPASPEGEPSHADRRWYRRFEVWQLAERDRQRLSTDNSPEVRELIVKNALGRGMFSIWWTVFVGDVDMRRILREAFRGTDPSSFNPAEDLQPRPGGQI